MCRENRCVMVRSGIAGGSVKAGSKRQYGASISAYELSKIHCERFFDDSQACEGKDGNIVILAEVDGCLRGLGGAGMGGEKPFETSEAIEFAGLVARFEQPVSVEREVVADLDAERRFLIVDDGRDAERKRAWKIELPIVEEGSGMSGAGDGAFASGVDAENHAGGEASLESSAEPAVELGEQSGRGRIVVSQGAHGPHDERYRHEP